MFREYWCNFCFLVTPKIQWRLNDSPFKACADCIFMSSTIQNHLQRAKARSQAIAEVCLLTSMSSYIDDERFTWARAYVAGQPHVAHHCSASCHTHCILASSPACSLICSRSFVETDVKFVHSNTTSTTALKVINCARNWALWAQMVCLLSMEDCQWLVCESCDSCNTFLRVVLHI